MEYYTTGAGIWGNVFAVPSDVVDKYIKLAGAAQLKVLLWLLRNNDRRQQITANDIGAALNMNPIDVKDCMEFWISVGLFSKNDKNNNVSDSQNESNVNYIQQADEVSSSQNTNNEQKVSGVDAAVQNDVDNKLTEIKSDMNSYVPPKRTIAKAQKPDPIEVAQRISQDESFSALLTETEQILGRPLTHNDSSTLLMIHDQDGLPYEVITMILYFAKSENKLKMSYIEALGREWGSAEIDTLEKAEERINDILSRKAAWNIASEAFGLKLSGSPSKKQIEFADLWINRWGYTPEMLRIAYEICMNSRGEFNLSYVNGIIKKWHANGIMTEEDIKNKAKTQDNSSQSKGGSNNKSSKNSNDGDTSYDINSFKNYDIFE